MKKWKVATSLMVIALVVAWYAFRPERLVVNRRVDEAMPTGSDAHIGDRRFCRFDHHDKQLSKARPCIKRQLTACDGLQMRDRLGRRSG